MKFLIIIAFVTLFSGCAHAQPSPAPAPKEVALTNDYVDPVCGKGHVSICGHVPPIAGRVCWCSFPERLVAEASPSPSPAPVKQK